MKRLQPIMLLWLILFYVKAKAEPEESSEIYAHFCGDGIWSSIDAYDDDTYSASQTNNKPATISTSVSPSNVYDTYNADECRRVRRPWNALTTDEKHLYIDGLLELRGKAKDSMDLDELIACASPHDNSFGSITHHDSDYLFWHGYLVWELESRIRNLGGKYKCFGMPYWDFTHEYGRSSQETPYIFQTGLGGYGDPNEHWKVNGYSWDVTIRQYWSPQSPHSEANCTADGDQCPICSLKRAKDDEFANILNAQEIGEAIMNTPNFVDFEPWVMSECGLPHSVDNSYDPIWYLFHSMESYYQAMWVNCNGYDLIDVQDLDEYPMAFTAYCDPPDLVSECVGIELDEPLYFPGVLAKRAWSFIHDNELTIRKLYQLPQWNVIYDLNGDSFFTQSKLEGKCKDKLNSEWFILPAEISNDDKEELIQTNFEFILQDFAMDAYVVMIVGVGFIALALLVLWVLKDNKSKRCDAEYTNYGSIAF